MPPAPAVESSRDAPRIVGLGMSVLDLVQVVDEFPGGEGVTRVRESVLMGGGPVPTALCAASRLGASAAILDRIGDDWRADRILDDYHRFGVCTRHLQREPGRRSTSGTVLVRARDGERHLLYDEGDFTPLSSEELPTDLLAGCRILHLNGRHWPACLAAARRVHENGGLVSFDGGAHRYQPKFDELLPHVDLLVVAASFADQAVGPGPRQEQLERLARHGSRLVGITDGVRGSWFLVEGGRHFHQPAIPISGVVDTTGCGDVFHGAFLASVLAGLEWETCARRAAAAAALSATALGGRGHLPDSDQIDHLLAQTAFP